MRNVSVQGMRELFAQESGAVFAPAVTFYFPEQDEELSFIANTESITHTSPHSDEDVTYHACAFTLTLAADNEDTNPQVVLRVDNVGQELIATIRESTDYPDVYVQVLRLTSAASPPTCEAGPTKMNLTGVTIDTKSIEAVLGYQMDFLNEPATSWRFTPGLVPGIYR